MRFSPFVAFLLASAGLTSAKQQEECPPKPQPLRHIKFTDSNAGGLHNYELHGNARIVEPAPYPVGRALRIDQMYSYALLKDLDISPSKKKDLTMSIDVYIESIRPNANGWILGHDNGGWDRAIFLHDPRFNGMGFTAGFRPAKLPQWTPPPVGKWMQIVAIWRQRGYCELYVDKVKVKHIDWCNNSDGLPDLSIGSLQDPVFGAVNDNDVWIKEVQVYDKALSAEELAALECDFQGNLEPSIDCGNGGPLVTSCTDCAIGGDPSGCGGDCAFDGTIPICKDVDPSEPLVSCGTFQASSCAACTAGAGGASDCAGDCKFDVASGTCVDEDYVPPSPPKAKDWTKINGGLKYVSVSRYGKHVWGVSYNDKIWYRAGRHGEWTQINGGLKQVSVSANGAHVWGVSYNDKIWYRNFPNDTSWTQINGGLIHVSVSANGSHVWGVSSNSKVWYRNFPNDTSWTQISGSLKQVDVSANGEHIWGVTSEDHIYYRNGKDGVWTRISGSLKHVSVSADGSHVWGVTSEDHIYYRNFPNDTSWTRISGSLKQVDVSANGEHVWGVTSEDHIYYRE